MGRYHDQRRDEDLPAVCPGELQCASLPAFDSKPTYLRTGAFVDVDSRDEPGNPRAGGRYTARVSSFKDQDLGLHDFAHSTSKSSTTFRSSISDASSLFERRQR